MDTTTLRKKQLPVVTGVLPAPQCGQPLRGLPDDKERLVGLGAFRGVLSKGLPDCEASRVPEEEPRQGH